MDAPDNSSNLLELAVVAARNLPVVGWGGVLVDLLAAALIAASSPSAYTTTPATPSAATSALVA